MYLIINIIKPKLVIDLFTTIVSCLRLHNSISSLRIVVLRYAKQRNRLSKMQYLYVRMKGIRCIEKGEVVVKRQYKGRLETLISEYEPVMEVDTAWSCDVYF